MRSTLIHSLGILLAGIILAQEPPVKPEPVVPENSEQTGEVTGKKEETTPPAEKNAPVHPAPEEKPPTIPAAEDPAKLFKKGFDLGRVGDSPTGAHRRLVQRTIMLTEPKPHYGCTLTFDDQIIPLDPAHSSALDIAKDLQKRGARGIFFANVPHVSGKNLTPILRLKKGRKHQLEQTMKLLEPQREKFITGIRELLKIKKDDTWICEVYNHTAFHQDMKRFKAGSARMDIALAGIRFVQECIDAAYDAERPGEMRTRWFRFPFLHEPRDKKAEVALNELFTELGLLTLGETQDSKDFTNESAKHAYRSLAAAKKGRRYSVKKGVYGRAEQPIALFHTKTWKKIKPGVLKFLDENPKPEVTPTPTPEQKTETEVQKAAETEDEIR